MTTINKLKMTLSVLTVALSMFAIAATTHNVFATGDCWTVHSAICTSVCSPTPTPACYAAWGVTYATLVAGEYQYGVQDAEHSGWGSTVSVDRICDCYYYYWNGANYTSSSCPNGSVGTVRMPIQDPQHSCI
jgi:hypothetical protein